MASKDILQVLALGRKRIILVEMGEGVGKRVVDKGNFDFNPAE